MTLLASFRPYASHDGNREALVRREAAEPHLEDSGIYRKRWWAYFDDRQNRLRTVAGDSVSLLWTLGCTLFQM